MAVEGHNLPWLQELDADTDGQADIRSKVWNVTWRDVIILDGDNVQVGKNNLTVNNLAEPAKYAQMRDMLFDAVFHDQRPYTNWRRPLDANNDGTINLVDANLLLTELDLTRPHALDKPASGVAVTRYLDCNRDGYFAPLDALWVINHLNAPAAEGEADALGNGESPELLTDDCRADTPHAPPPSPRAVPGPLASPVPEPPLAAWSVDPYFSALATGSTTLPRPHQTPRPLHVGTLDEDSPATDLNADDHPTLGAATFGDELLETALSSAITQLSSGFPGSRRRP